MGKMADDINLDFVFTRKYSLTDKSLDRMCEDILSKTGLSVYWYEVENGYVFRDSNYNVRVGDLFFNNRTGNYESFHLSPSFKEEIDIKKRAEKEKLETREKRRHFVLQVGKVVGLGLCITVAGAAVLNRLGVIKLPISNDSQSLGTSAVGVAENTKRNTLTSCNDLLAVYWANYAMTEVGNIVSKSEYEYFKSQRDFIYQELFAPLMSNYYSYLDVVDAGLPYFDELGDKDIVGNNHDRFRTSLQEFNNYLSDQPYFKSCVFANTPFANAIVADSNNNVIESNGEHLGEVLDANGKIIDMDTDGVEVYVRISDVPGLDYSVNNIPDGSIVFEGKLYVKYSVLYNHNIVTKN